MKKYLEKEGRSAVLGTVIIAVAMIVIFGAVFAWMYSMDLLFLPDFAEKLFGLSDDDGIPEWNLGALSEIVKDGKNDSGEVLTFDITYENLKAAFLGEEEPDGIYISADISYYDGEEASKKRVRFYKNGDRFRSETYAIGDSERLETLKIADSENVVFTDHATGESRILSRSQDICAENEAGIPSVDNLFYVIDSFPKALSENATGDAVVTQTGIEDCTIMLVRYGDSNVYYVSFVYTDLGLREEYYVSLDHRIIISCYTTKNGVPVYSYETVRVSTQSEVWSEDALYTMDLPSESGEE